MKTQEKLTPEIIWQMFAETDKRFKESDKRFKETDKKLDKRFKETEIFLNKIGKQLGSIGHNNGLVAEEFFFQGFSSTMQVGEIKYDYIEKNKERLIKKLRGEYDIVLINHEQILIIEVKYKFHPNDVEIFIEYILPKFKKLFPEYIDYTIYGAIAGLSVPEAALLKAKQYGLMCFTQSGEKIKKLSSEDLILTKF